MTITGTWVHGHGPILQNENIGAYTIKGIQSNLYYKPINKKWQLSLNYTYTDPWQTKDMDTTVDLKVADIAFHKLNAIVNIMLWKNLNINMRVNYVGKKRAGEGTTVPRNINNSFDDYIKKEKCVSNLPDKEWNIRIGFL